MPSLLNPHPRIFCIDFRERKGEREREREREERERERHLHERETLIGCLLYASQLEIKPTTQIWALTRDWTYTLLVYGMTLQLTELPCEDILVPLLRGCLKPVEARLSKLHTVLVFWYICQDCIYIQSFPLQLSPPVISRTEKQHDGCC